MTSATYALVPQQAPLAGPAAQHMENPAANPAPANPRLSTTALENLATFCTTLGACLNQTKAACLAESRMWFRITVNVGSTSNMASLSACTHSGGVCFAEKCVSCCVCCCTCMGECSDNCVRA